MPIIFKKQEEKPKEAKALSFEDLRQKAMQRSAYSSSDIELDASAKEADRLRLEILELKRSRNELQKAKEREREKGVSLTVDGEKRKVSKTSRYLLDMLTLDDQ